MAAATSVAPRTIFVLNGSNLNLLGMRQPEIHGTTTLADIEADCRRHVEQAGHDLVFRHTNAEHISIEWVREARGTAAAIVIIRRRSPICRSRGWTH